MKTLIMAAGAAATLVTTAPSAMAQPWGYGYHHHWHRHWGPGWGYGPGWRRPFYGHRRFCYYHPYRC